jgi:hypothetical protein
MRCSTNSKKQPCCPSVTAWAALMLLLAAPGCFRSPDTSKIPCLSLANCPSGFHCAKDQGAVQGMCVPGLVNADGSVADGKGGGLGDGLSTSGAGGTSANLGGAGGTGGSAGGAGGVGSGGSAISDGPIASGGTPSTPDAPLLNDASMALPNGSVCTTDGECSNGSCVDGHCCDGKCDGNCETCVTGTCSFTSTPRKSCGGSGTCAGICAKSNTKACTFDTTAVCASQSCSGGVRTNKSLCDVLGNCPAQTKTTCDSNLCTTDGSDCSGSCVGVSCGTGKYCAGSTCAPLKSQGDACSSDTECSTSHCVDGYCCESACTGACTSCAVTHGKCTNTTSLRTGKSCSGTAPCNATCNGSSPDCVPASVSTPCGSASCLSPTLLQLVGTCTSQGTCSQSTQPCTSCVAGACADCTPGVDRRCSAGSPQKCDTSGHWVNDTPCGTGQICSGAGSCGCPAANPNACGSSCTNFSTDNSNCGSCGKTCSPPNTCGGNGVPGVCGCKATASCGSRVCGSVSDACVGTINCGTCSNAGQTCNSSGSCVCALGVAACNSCLGWGFESGVGSWQAVPGAYNAIYGSVTTATLHPTDGGAASLVFYANIDPAGNNSANITSPLCPSGNTVSVNGNRLSFEIMVDTTIAGVNILWMGMSGGSRQTGGTLGSGSDTLVAGTWYPLYTDVLSGTVPLDTLQIMILGTSYWSGNIYIDNIQFH